MSREPVYVNRDHTPKRIMFHSSCGWPALDAGYLDYLWMVYRA